MPAEGEGAAAAQTFVLGDVTFTYPGAWTAQTKENGVIELKLGDAFVNVSRSDSALDDTTAENVRKNPGLARQSVGKIDLSSIGGGESLAMWVGGVGASDTEALVALVPTSSALVGWIGFACMRWAAGGTYNFVTMGPYEVLTRRIGEIAGIWQSAWPDDEVPAEEAASDGEVLTEDEVAAIQPESEGDAAAEPAPDSADAVDGVTPEFKAMMDEYEAFMGEYVDFMNTYMSSGDVVGMLTDYADIMRRYGEWVEKIDAVDQTTLSTADAAYYLEVTARVTQKLLEIA